MNKDYVRNSPVAGYIDGLLAEKRALGFSYHFEEYVLNEFDHYCITHELKSASFDRCFMEEWLSRNGNEGTSYHSQRISFVRQLALYMNALGIRAYIPVESISVTVTVPHFLSKDELTAFFSILDSDRPRIPALYAWRLWNEYRVAFRLLYCCGMRNSEACDLKTENVDLEKGIITIYHSKGDKDRIIYLSDDMKELLKEYLKYLTETLGCYPVWFFPARDPHKHIHKSTLDRRFNRIWDQTLYAGTVNRKPTVHSLRHSYVVDRMNSWLSEGKDFDTMMPYLSRYLGHSSINESMYYYHLSEDANRFIRKNDPTAKNVIPEAGKYGK